MLVDVNLLLYAAFADAPEHERAAAWMERQMNGDRRVGLPWECLVGFVRLATNPRVTPQPMRPSTAWQFVTDWLAVPVSWIPMATEQHADVLGRLITKYRPTAKLVPDTHLVALAIEHGLEICSADTDFARFTEVRWRNPLA